MPAADDIGMILDAAVRGDDALAAVLCAALDDERPEFSAAYARMMRRMGYRKVRQYRKRKKTITLWKNAITGERVKDVAFRGGPKPTRYAKKGELPATALGRAVNRLMLQYGWRMTASGIPRKGAGPRGKPANRWYNDETGDTQLSISMPGTRGGGGKTSTAPPQRNRTSAGKKAQAAAAAQQQAAQAAPAPSGGQTPAPSTGVTPQGQQGAATSTAAPAAAPKPAPPAEGTKARSVYDKLDGMKTDGVTTDTLQDVFSGLLGGTIKELNEVREGLGIPRRGYESVGTKSHRSQELIKEHFGPMLEAEGVDLPWHEGPPRPKGATPKEAVQSPADAQKEAATAQPEQAPAAEQPPAPEAARTPASPASSAAEELRGLSAQLREALEAGIEGPGVEKVKALVAKSQEANDRAAALLKPPAENSAQPETPPEAPPAGEAQKEAAPAQPEQAPAGQPPVENLAQPETPAAPEAGQAATGANLPAAPGQTPARPGKEKRPPGALPPVFGLKPNASFYDVLGVPPDADQAAIDRAVDARVDELRKYQTAQPGRTSEIMNRVAAASDVLGDASRRKEYDASLAAPPPARERPKAGIRDVEETPVPGPPHGKVPRRERDMTGLGLSGVPRPPKANPTLADTMGPADGRPADDPTARKPAKLHPEPPAPPLSDTMGPATGRSADDPAARKPAKLHATPPEVEQAAPEANPPVAAGGKPEAPDAGPTPEKGPAPPAGPPKRAPQWLDEMRADAAKATGQSPPPTQPPAPTPPPPAKQGGQTPQERFPVGAEVEWMDGFPPSRVTGTVSKWTKNPVTGDMVPWVKVGNSTGEWPKVDLLESGKLIKPAKSSPPVAPPSSPSPDWINQHLPEKSPAGPAANPPVAEKATTPKGHTPPAGGGLVLPGHKPPPPEKMQEYLDFLGLKGGASRREYEDAVQRKRAELEGRGPSDGDYEADARKLRQAYEYVINAPRDKPGTMETGVETLDGGLRADGSLGHQEPKRPVGTDLTKPAQNFDERMNAQAEQLGTDPHALEKLDALAEQEAAQKKAAEAPKAFNPARLSDRARSIGDVPKNRQEKKFSELGLEKLPPEQARALYEHMAADDGEEASHADPVSGIRHLLGLPEKAGKRPPAAAPRDAVTSPREVPPAETPPSPINTEAYKNAPAAAPTPPAEEAIDKGAPPAAPEVPPVKAPRAAKEPANAKGAKYLAAVKEKARVPGSPSSDVMTARNRAGEGLPLGDVLDVAAARGKRYMEAVYREMFDRGADPSWGVDELKRRVADALPRKPATEVPPATAPQKSLADVERQLKDGSLDEAGVRAALAETNKKLTKQQVKMLGESFGLPNGPPRENAGQLKERLARHIIESRVKPPVENLAQPDNEAIDRGSRPGQAPETPPEAAEKPATAPASPEAQKSVLSAIGKTGLGTMTVADLREATGLPRAEFDELVKRMSDEGLLIPHGDDSAAKYTPDDPRAVWDGGNVLTVFSLSDAGQKALGGEASATPPAAPGEVGENLAPAAKADKAAGVDDDLLAPLRRDEEELAARGEELKSEVGPEKWRPAAERGRRVAEAMTPRGEFVDDTQARIEDMDELSDADLRKRWDDAMGPSFERPRGKDWRHVMAKHIARAEVEDARGAWEKANPGKPDAAAEAANERKYQERLKKESAALPGVGKFAAMPDEQLAAEWARTFVHENDEGEPEVLPMPQGVNQKLAKLEAAVKLAKAEAGPGQPDDEDDDANEPGFMHKRPGPKAAGAAPRHRVQVADYDAIHDGVMGALDDAEEASLLRENLKSNDPRTREYAQAEYDRLLDDFDSPRELDAALKKRAGREEALMHIMDAVEGASFKQVGKDKKYHEFDYSPDTAFSFERAAAWVDNPRAAAALRNAAASMREALKRGEVPSAELKGVAAPARELARSIKEPVPGKDDAAYIEKLALFEAARSLDEALSAGGAAAQITPQMLPAIQSLQENASPELAAALQRMEAAARAVLGQKPAQKPKEAPAQPVEPPPAEAAGVSSRPMPVGLRDQLTKALEAAGLKGTPGYEALRTAERTPGKAEGVLTKNVTVPDTPEVREAVAKVKDVVAAGKVAGNWRKAMEAFSDGPAENLAQPAPAPAKPQRLGERVKAAKGDRAALMEALDDQAYAGKDFYKLGKDVGLPHNKGEKLGDYKKRLVDYLAPGEARPKDAKPADAPADDDLPPPGSMGGGAENNQGATGGDNEQPGPGSDGAGGGGTLRENAFDGGALAEGGGRPAGQGPVGERVDDVKPAGQAAVRGLPGGRVLASEADIEEKIGRYKRFFASKVGDKASEYVSTLLDQLMEDVQALGGQAALDALGEATGEAGGPDVQYWGVGPEEHDWKNIGDFMDAYLKRNGIIAVMGDTSDPNLPLISSLSKVDKDKPGEKDFVPDRLYYTNKLDEAKALPGLEASEDLDTLTGGPVSHLTADVMASLDRKYGKGRWIVKPYDENAAMSYGIFFPQRAQAYVQDAKAAIQSVGQLLKEQGYQLHRDEAGKLVGLREGTKVFEFGSKAYEQEFHGPSSPKVTSKLAAKLARAADNEGGAKLPEGKFMAQPAFAAVGVTEQERADGVTFMENEGRVHLVTRPDGSVSVVPYATVLKNGMFVPVVFSNDDIRAMEKAAREAVEKIPYEARKGQVYAPDVMRTPSGYKVIELNAQGDSNGSGYLHDSVFAIDAYTSYLTGRVPAHVAFVRNLLTKRKQEGEGQKAADKSSLESNLLAAKSKKGISDVLDSSSLSKKDIQNVGIGLGLKHKFGEKLGDYKKRLVGYLLGRINKKAMQEELEKPPRLAAGGKGKPVPVPERPATAAEGAAAVKPTLAAPKPKFIR